MSNEVASDRLRLNSVHAIRALAALLVAALHSFSREQLEPDAFLPHWLEFARIGTDMFFVMSGAVMVYSTTNRARGLGPAASFLYDRITRIYPVYWIATAATLAVWSVSGHKFMAHLIRHPEPWSTILLVPNGHIPALLVAWTLSHLLLFYFLFSLTLLAPKKALPYILVIWVIAVLAMRLAGWGHESAPPLMRFLSHQASFEFIAGVVMMRAAMNGVRLPSLLLLCAGAAWLVGYVIGAGPNPDLTIFSNGDTRLLEVGIPAILFAGAAIFYDVHHKRQLHPAVKFLADVSFGVYLMHIMALAFVGRIWSMIAIPGPIDNILAFATMLGLSIFSGWVLHKYVEIPVREWTKAAKPKVIAALAFMSNPGQAKQVAEAPQDNNLR